PVVDAHFAHLAKGDFLSAHQWTFSTDQLRATSGFGMMQHAFGQGGARGTRQPRRSKMYRLVTATITLARQASRPSHWARSLRCTRPLPFRLARISPDSAGGIPQASGVSKIDQVRCVCNAWGDAAGRGRSTGSVVTDEEVGALKFRLRGLNLPPK